MAPKRQRQAAPKRGGDTAPSSALPRRRTRQVVEKDALPLEAPPALRDAFLPGHAAPNCGACLLPLEEETKVGLLDNCAHVFHFDCAERWATAENSCPQCKRRFFWLAAYTAGRSCVPARRVSLQCIKARDQEAEEDDAFEEVQVCETCREIGDEAALLLCDGMHGTCNAAHHYTCVGLLGVPHGSWFCPDCVDRGYDIDAGGNRGSAKRSEPSVVADRAAVETPTASPSSSSVAPVSTVAAAPEIPPAPAPLVPTPQGSSVDNCLSNVGQATAARPRRGAASLPPQMRLSALACASPAVEVPRFLAAGGAPPASSVTSGEGNAPSAGVGLFASFAERRRRKRAASGISPDVGTFITLDPTYEEDFMGKKSLG